MAFEWIWLSLVVVSASIGSGVFAALWLVHRPALTLIDDGALPRTIFILERGAIVDASDAAQLLLDGIGSDEIGADGLVRWLSDAFPGLPGAIRNLAGNRVRSLTARDGVGRINVSRTGPRVRLELTDDESVRVGVDRVMQTALNAELDTLRGIADSLPYAVWRQAGDGRIRWVNRAYLDLLAEVEGGDPSVWPPPALFEETLHPCVRTRVRAHDRWFDCHATPVGGELLVSAVPADAVVAAETALDAFRQTISHTFAHLTVGLAIFDAERRLSVFNPALTGLTSLPADLLASRPTLESFLDALRARRMTPEPRDFATWRDRVADVERNARNGTYSEQWHLPGGRVYRVTGRPQPDGAFALLVEDVSAETGLARRFRGQVETQQIAFDAIDLAVAVFDHAGTLVLSNAAYLTLWDVDPEDGLAHLTLSDAVRAWRKRSMNVPIWRELAAGAPRPEAPDRHEVRLSDGRLITVTRTPLPLGALMLQFAVPGRRDDALSARRRRIEPGLKKA